VLGFTVIAEKEGEQRRVYTEVATDGERIPGPPRPFNELTAGAIAQELEREGWATEVVQSAIYPRLPEGEAGHSRGPSER
jgi:hypothetical protein